MPARSHLALSFLLGLAAIAGAGAQTQDPSRLAKGRLLVADPSLQDPNFFETVILLLNYDDKGALGLVINRPTPIRLAKLLPQIEGLQNKEDTAYLGGPVETGKMIILVRSSDEVEDADAVINDVYVSSSATLLEKLGSVGAKTFRGYAGYAGWGPGQLEGEVEDGAWNIMPASAALVFDAHPEQIWKRLSDHAQTRIAFDFRP